MKTFKLFRYNDATYYRYFLGDRLETNGLHVIIYDGYGKATTIINLLEGDYIALQDDIEEPVVPTE